MKPLTLFQTLKDLRLDLREVLALEIMSEYSEREPTQTLITACLKRGVSSQASTHKYIARLKRRRYIEDVPVKGADKRIHYIRITDKGRDFLAKVSA